MKYQQEFHKAEGLVLGPLLFLIFLNDLHNCMKYSKTYDFADDPSII